MKLDDFKKDIKLLAQMAVTASISGRINMDKLNSILDRHGLFIDDDGCVEKIFEITARDD